MTIKVGDRIPNATLNYLKDGVQAINTDEIFKGKKVVLFSVPGAFTPTCSASICPDMSSASANSRRRVWNRLHRSERCVRDERLGQGPARAGRLWMLADGNGAFTKALGLEMDGTAFGLGMRGKRFALYADDGVVKHLWVEAPGEFKVSAADAVMAEIA